jgi:hypothetical protein
MVTRARTKTIDDDDNVAKDGETVHVPMYLMDADPVQRSIAAHRRRTPGTQVVTDGLGGAARLHQPGSRFLSGSVGRVVADARSSPRDQYVARLRDAYRMRDELDPDDIQTHINALHALGVDLSQLAEQDDDSDADEDIDDAVRVRDAAYAKRNRFYKNSWRDAQPAVALEYGPQSESGKGADTDAERAAYKKKLASTYLTPPPGYCAQFDPAVIRQALALASVNPMLGPPLTSASTPPMSETESGRYVEKLIAARNRKEQNTADALKVRCQQLENSWRTDPTAASKIERQREKWTDE